MVVELPLISAVLALPEYFSRFSSYSLSFPIHLNFLLTIAAYLFTNMI